MKGSLVIIGFFVAGVACGMFQWMPADVTGGRLSFYALCA